jgi:hypothetical protein
MLALVHFEQYSFCPLPAIHGSCYRFFLMCHRVVGTYIDPLVVSGDVEQLGPFDSQQGIVTLIGAGHRILHP